MSYIEKAMRAVSDARQSFMHTGFPATVVDYNEDKHTCTIQPLFKLDNGSDYPQVLNVPVFKLRFKQIRQKGYPALGRSTEAGTPHGHFYTWTDPAGSGTTQSESSHIHPILYEEYVEEIKLLLYPGDLVWCGVSERSIDSMQSKKVHTPQSKRTFDLSDAVVLCLL